MDGRADRSPLLAVRTAAEVTVASCGLKMPRIAERTTRNRSAVPARGCVDAATLDQPLSHRHLVDRISPPMKDGMITEALYQSIDSICGLELSEQHSKVCRSIYTYRSQ